MVEYSNRLAMWDDYQTIPVGLVTYPRIPTLNFSTSSLECVSSCTLDNFRWNVPVHEDTPTQTTKGNVVFWCMDWASVVCNGSCHYFMWIHPSGWNLPSIIVTFKVQIWTFTTKIIIVSLSRKTELYDAFCSCDFYLF